MFRPLISDCPSPGQSNVDSFWCVGHTLGRKPLQMSTSQPPHVWLMLVTCWDTWSLWSTWFPTKISHWFYKYWGFLPEITTGIATCQMVIFLTSLTYTVTWNLKNYYFFSTSFLWGQRICETVSSCLMSTACSALLYLPKPEWHWALSCTSEDL